ncbi:hypothetical protein TNIN_191331 [Trichonephila inaurata madagascariensis]|uniref:Uncharacterized protein n=1 Tax=Trichonephila inaurata madagascariensis TaxID=2747483 RepID=A0A8X7BXQ2_9ARAC|nr:hypothetical protein TNIN_191331 [Trichonephila inaurata madagascariensis]
MMQLRRIKLIFLNGQWMKEKKNRKHVKSPVSSNFKRRSPLKEESDFKQFKRTAEERKQGEKEVLRQHREKQVEKTDVIREKTNEMKSEHGGTVIRKEND